MTFLSWNFGSLIYLDPLICSIYSWLFWNFCCFWISPWSLNYFVIFYEIKLDCDFSVQRIIHFYMICLIGSCPFCAQPFALSLKYFWVFCSSSQYFSRCQAQYYCSSISRWSFCWLIFSDHFSWAKNYYCHLFYPRWLGYYENWRCYFLIFRLLSCPFCLKNYRLFSWYAEERQIYFYDAVANLRILYFWM